MASGSALNLGPNCWECIETHNLLFRISPVDGGYAIEEFYVSGRFAGKWMVNCVKKTREQASQFINDWIEMNGAR